MIGYFIRLRHVIKFLVIVVNLINQKKINYMVGIAFFTKPKFPPMSSYSAVANDSNHLVLM